MYRGQIVSVSEDTERRARRRVVNLNSFAREARKAIEPVTVTDLSTEGCRLTSAGGFAPTGTIWVKIQGLVAKQADICWAEGGEAGCRFHSPFDQLVIDQLVADSRHSFRQLRGRFTVTPATGDSEAPRTGTSG